MRKLLRKIYNAGSALMKDPNGQKELTQILHKGIDELHKANEEDSRGLELKDLESLDTLLKNV
jgi:hypothetical protein